jgi:hypothetical protein
MIVGFDMDGVIYPWHEAVWNWYRIWRDSEMSYNDFWKHPDGFVYQNEGTQVIKNLVQIPHLYTMHDIKRRTLKALNDFNKLADDIWYITARPSMVRLDTINWMKRNDLPKHENLIFSDLNGGKVKTVEEKGCDFYLEDRHIYIEPLSEVTNVFVINRPYNIGYDYSEIDNVYRADDVEDVYNLVRKVKNGLTRVSAGSSQNGSLSY